jgi:zinc dependent phospholipase C
VFRGLVRRSVGVGVVLLLAAAADVRAYSVLSHEASIDALWDSTIRPLIARKFPKASSDDLLKARAYAYGGSVIQDLGYYPFGSRFFSNVLHYVRSGDFVEELVRDAHDPFEYGFALGALAHYFSDNVGHPEGVNRSVALMFPKLRAQHGDTVTYADSPSSHVMVEFSFDVVQAATGRYHTDAYQRFVGFEVARPALERAFVAIYGLEMKDVFVDEDLAIGSYRHAISQTMPEITRIAWRDKREEIEQALPGVASESFLFNLSKQDYEQRYGATYRKPGLLARFLAFLYKLLPKIGPLKGLQFKAPTPEAEALFLESLRDTRERYRRGLDAAGAGRFDLANTNFDTGKPSAHGEYSLADETHAELLHRLAKRKFSGVPDALRRNLVAFYAKAPERAASRKERKQLARVKEELAALGAATQAKQ